MRYTSATRRQPAGVTMFVVLLLALAGVTILSPPAFADSVLCSGGSYSTCTNAGYTDHGYSGNTASYWRMDPGHNCTNYVAYVEQTVNSAPVPSYLLGNAYQWGPNASAHGVPVNGTLAPGAVAWWNQNTSRGSLGHVAYVESVKNDGSITVSEDVANSGPFSWEVISPGSSRWPTNFIHFHDLYHYQVVAGDFNGDGQADIGLRDASTGTFYIKHGPGFNDQISYAWAAGANYQVVVGDFDGDGQADIGLRNADIGVIYIKHGPGFGDQISYPWAAG